MKLKALSHYNGDMDTRYGDCILLYDSTSLVVYDCGHAQHAQVVEDLLYKNALISKVHIVISHNDGDHIDGIEKLMEYLYSKGYDVTVETKNPVFSMLSSVKCRNSQEINDFSTLSDTLFYPLFQSRKYLQCCSHSNPEGYRKSTVRPDNC